MGNIAVVFAGLVGTAKAHVGDRRLVHIRVSRHQGSEGNGAQIVGAHGTKGTAVATERGADGVTDEGLGHGCVG